MGMISFHNLVLKLPNYVRRFGFIHGLRLLTQIVQHSGDLQDGRRGGSIYY